MPDNKTNNSSEIMKIIFTIKRLECRGLCEMFKSKSVQRKSSPKPKSWEECSILGLIDVGKLTSHYDG